jgi:hypothetical protein
MICLYILKHPKNVSLDKIVFQTPFLPKTEMTYDFQYNPQDFDNHDTVYIMPTTYENNIPGKFIISAYCDSPVKMTRFGGA